MWQGGEGFGVLLCCGAGLHSRTSVTSAREDSGAAESMGHVEPHRSGGAAEGARHACVAQPQDPGFPRGGPNATARLSGLPTGRCELESSKAAKQGHTKPAQRWETAGVSLSMHPVRMSTRLPSSVGCLRVVARRSLPRPPLPPTRPCPPPLPGLFPWPPPL